MDETVAPAACPEVVHENVVARLVCTPQSSIPISTISGSSEESKDGAIAEVLATTPQHTRRNRFAPVAEGAMVNEEEIENNGHEAFQGNTERPGAPSCKCHVAICDLCGVCSRCGCGHDGTTPARAVKRKRGQRGKAKKARRTNPKRAKNTYKEGDLYVSPLPNMKTFSASEDFVLFSAFPSSNPAVTTRAVERCDTVQDVLRSFGMGAKVSSTLARLPSLERRQNISTWRRVDNQDVKSARGLLSVLFTKMCTVFCGDNEETGAQLSNLLLRTESKAENDDLETDISHIIADCYSQAEKNSIEKRVLRACLTHIPRSKLRKQFPKRPNFTLSCDSYAGREDLVSLLSGVKLKQATRSIRRYDEAEVSKAVSLILSPVNISFLSWGTKRIKVGSKWITLPAINRRHSKTRIYNSYVEQLTTTPARKILSRATFFRIISAVTAGGSQTRKAVDYVVGFLVNDSFDLLRKIIPAISATHDDGERLISDMEVARSYLKYGFDSRVREGEICLLHLINYGLQHHSDVSTLSLCKNCTNLFDFFDRIKLVAISTNRVDFALTTIDDCREKAKLYLGHRIRVINQQRAISKLSDDMKSRCLSTKATDEAVVLIDFKMKLEPMYYREKSVEHYGKRGMSWHGASVQYWEYQEGECDGEPPDLVAQTLYYDHISSGDNKQDRECVISLLEAILIRLKKDLPYVKRIVLQSDNAPCYQNMLLPLVLPFLSAAHGIEIVRFIHTDTQDGKSILDAHFARAMQALMNGVREGNNCITPTQVTIGLNASGGVKNAVVELVEYDREHLKILVDQVTAMEGQLKKLFSRANDIFISFVGHKLPTTTDVNTYEQCPPFYLQIFEYSGIGDGINLLCSPGAGSVQIMDLLTSQQVLASGNGNGKGDRNDEEDEESENEGEHDGGGTEDESDSDCDSEVEGVEESTDLIQVQVVKGIVTGINIATQGQLRKRVRRWKKRSIEVRIERPTSDPVDVVSSAVRAVVSMHGSSELCVQEPSGLYRMCSSDNYNCLAIPTFLSDGRFGRNEGQCTGAGISTSSVILSANCLSKGEKTRHKKLALAE